jgi:hypothetical protein
VRTTVAIKVRSISKDAVRESHGLSVCIPVYNESGAVGETIERCLACGPALREAGVDRFEVIAVDDGSSDDTAEQIRKFPVRLIQHTVNRGYGAALKTGFAAAQYDLVGFLDADATYPPEYFPDLCRALIVQEADMVVGSRMSGAATEMPWTRRLGNTIFARLLTTIGRTRVSDTASGMRVFRKTTLPLLLPLPDGLNLTPVMSTRAMHELVSAIEVPIPYQERVGVSKLSIVRDGARFLETIVWTAMTYNPVRILGIAGIVSMALSVLVGLTLLFLRIQGVTNLGPLGTYAVFAALVSGAAGASVFALGASFNYLVSLSHRRSIRQGLFKRPLLTVPIEKLFLPSGILATAVGLGASLVSLGLSFQGWPIERLWLYLSGSAMLMLIGIQLSISWLEMSVLRELSQRGDLETIQ